MGKWISDNYQWLIPTIVATIAILVSILIAKKQNKEKRFELYKLIKKYFEKIVNKNFSDIHQLEELLLDNNNPFYDKIELSKAKYLFNKKTCKLIENLIKKCNDVTELRRCLDKLYDYIIIGSKLHLSVKEDFKEVVQDYFGNKGKYKESSLKSICDMCAIRKIKLCDDEELRDYNYYDLYKEKEKKINEFKSKFDELIKLMEKQLKL